ncbi:MAG: RNA 2',3'-cyclic phosphodiesterase [Spirochaetaceae bacterium]|jgi:2'-5' RNA ligase|nr:RNA 2',3'-cyclic phosphodiesterase [Spirochaetaceae bacterium]
MRLFIAVNVDQEIKRRILEVQDRIRKEVNRGKFPPKENFHITLVFLGETPEERLPAIKEAMIQAASTGGKPVSAFEFSFSKAGFFKRGGKELWWLGTDTKNDRLENLQKNLTSELLARNFVFDNKPFTAHITLGREIRSELWPFNTENIAVPVNRLSLMQSQHLPAAEKKSAVVYTELFGCDLG